MTAVSHFSWHSSSASFMKVAEGTGDEKLAEYRRLSFNFTGGSVLSLYLKVDRNIDIANVLLFISLYLLPIPLHPSLISPCLPPSPKLMLPLPPHYKDKKDMGHMNPSRTPLYPASEPSSAQQNVPLISNILLHPIFFLLTDKIKLR